MIDDRKGARIVPVAEKKGTNREIHRGRKKKLEGERKNSRVKVEPVNPWYFRGRKKTGSVRISHQKKKKV